MKQVWVLAKASTVIIFISLIQYPYYDEVFLFVSDAVVKDVES